MSAARRILIIEPEPALRRSLAEQLALDGEFDSRECATAQQALTALACEPVDAILLAATLPDMDAGELCRRLRGGSIRAPVIALIAAEGGTAADLGADDWVAKPVRLSLLLDRLRARLGPVDGGAEGVVIGPYTFRPDAKLLFDPRRRREVRLTEKETAILDCLYRARDRAMTRAALLDAVWGYHAGIATHTLETHVYRLRRKIERDPARAEILVTAPDGYRLVP